MGSRPAWVGLGLPEEAPATTALSDERGGSVNDHLRRELEAQGGESTTLRITGAAAASVDAYVEYRRIVGDADGGVLFTGTLQRNGPCCGAEHSLQLRALPRVRSCNACSALCAYGAVARRCRGFLAPPGGVLTRVWPAWTDEEYARFRAAALSERSANRIYVTWRSAAGVDCKVRLPCGGVCFAGQHQRCLRARAFLCSQDTQRLNSNMHRRRTWVLPRPASAGIDTASTRPTR